MSLYNGKFNNAALANDEMDSFCKLNYLPYVINR